MPPLENIHWNFPKMPKLRLHTPPRGADPQVNPESYAAAAGRLVDW